MAISKTAPTAGANTLVIAHRGASGYLPEHTLPAKALAHAMGAHFIEQDVVLTRDGIPIVLHDIHLDSTTNVAQVFPDRASVDGHFYATDFSLEEITRLNAHERCTTDSSGQRQAVYAHRFPLNSDFFKVPTLEQEIDFIAGLDKSRGKTTGLHVELKSPLHHKQKGLDLPGAIMDVLERKGYADRPQQVFLQCFDDKTLLELRNTYQTTLPLIQLIAENSWGENNEVDYDFLRSDDGLKVVAQYAQGIGPWVSHIYLGKDASGKPVLSDLVERAKHHGLAIHPYTFRKDDLPDGIDHFQELLDMFIGQLQVDALFTDFPDLVMNYLRDNEVAER